MDEKLRSRLFEFNKFWKQPLDLAYVSREIYSEIRSLIASRQMISLCGLRRVGKTTLLQKIILDLLKNNAPTDVLYFSFDDFQSEPNDVLKEFVEIHGKAPKFVFFDEIQKVHNWSEKIKIIYDFNKYKIFLSGSESLFIKKGNLESLAGRIYEFEVTKLSFKEFLAFREKTKFLENPVLFDRELELEFHDYVLTAGFPELINEKNPEIIKKYINSLIDKIIFVDIPKIFKIDDASQLKTLLEILIDNPGMIVDVQSLSNELGVFRHTLSKYLACLEAGHLVTKLYNFSRNKSTSEKKLKKFYPTILTPAIALNLSENYYSKIIESIVVHAVNAKYFWRDQYKDEVDAIHILGKQITPIEVKYRSNPELNKGVEKFSEKYSCKTALVITKNTTKKQDKNNTKINYLPVHQFLAESKQQK